MTLIDGRPGIQAAWDEVSARTGVNIDSVAAVRQLGPPLAVEAERWFPPEQVPAVVELFRSIYAQTALVGTVALPGAAQALSAVREHGGRILVVTAKLARFAREQLTHFGLHVDLVAGEVFGVAKGEVLRSNGASIYVGDHVADIEASRAGACISVGVPTGSFSAEQLRSAGADVVVDNLVAFAEWLRGRSMVL